MALREVSPAPWRYEIQLRDQSLFFAGAVTFERDALVVQDPMLGTVRLPVAELASLKRRILDGPAK